MTTTGRVQPRRAVRHRSRTVEAVLRRAARVRVDREIHPPDELSAQLLGLTAPLGMTASYLVRDGLVLELLHFAAPRQTQPYRARAMNEPGLTHVSLSVDDVDAMLERVAEFGGEVLADDEHRGGRVRPRPGRPAPGAAPDGVPRLPRRRRRLSDRAGRTAAAVRSGIAGGLERSGQERRVGGEQRIEPSAGRRRRPGRRQGATGRRQGGRRGAAGAGRRGASPGAA